MGERKHSHTHTDIQKGANKPYLKKGKKDKRRIRTKSIQWKKNLRGHNGFIFKNSKTVSFSKDGRKEQQEYNYPADFN